MGNVGRRFVVVWRILFFVCLFVYFCLANDMEGHNVLFNDTLDTFLIWLYDIRGHNVEGMETSIF